MKKSSLIKEWLGKDVSQSLSIRMGLYLEKFFNELIGDNNLLPLFPQGMMEYNGELHQIDILCRVNDTIYTREIKCNLDLDRGKKRDVVRREELISQGLMSLFEEDVDSCLFNPFIDDTIEVSGLGKVEGLRDFISNLQLPLTVEEFKQIGLSDELHSVL